MMAFVVVQPVVSDSVTPWTAACQASLSFTISQNLLKLMSIDSMIPSNHLILCHLLLLLPSIFPSKMTFLSFLLRKSKTPDAIHLPNLSFLWECGTKCLEDNNFNVIIIIINTIAINIISRVSSTASRISRTYVLGFAYAQWAARNLHTLTHLTSHNSPMK